ncbi:hypothetical protein FSPOR_4826 [Fusarium sporotrichioides]|uniref:Uncharacterized protein n=1 Tax=Fusarium sporotrichioides TaxID=5514 RepID=A0A395SA99_FUSSP|nr:hypothetical protein FSPOR_4826 [Fusarium sporotrichioides]
MNWSQIRDECVKFTRWLNSNSKIIFLLSEENVRQWRDYLNLDGTVEAIKIELDRSRSQGLAKGRPFRSSGQSLHRRSSNWQLRLRNFNLWQTKVEGNSGDQEIQDVRRIQMPTQRCRYGIVKEQSSKCAQVPRVKRSELRESVAGKKRDKFLKVPSSLPKNKYEEKKTAMFRVKQVMELMAAEPKDLITIQQLMQSKLLSFNGLSH